MATNEATLALSIGDKGSLASIVPKEIPHRHAR